MYKNWDLPTPPFWLALIPIVVTGVSLGFSVFKFDAQPHFSLFLGAASAGLCAYFYGYRWDTIKDGFKSAINRTIPSIIILLIIGMLISVWIASGIVPALMYYGFVFLIEQWFLPLILLFSAFMALITGSSWSTIGTIGVAAMGVSQGLGIPPAITAGAVVSGSFFGDKISPMSDSTNLTPSVLGVNLFEHIRHMLYTTIPVLIVSFAVYAVIGILFVGNGEGSDVSIYTKSIVDNFNISVWLFVPPIIVIFLILRKVPAIPSLIAGVLSGGVVFILIQGGSFTALFDTVYSGFVLESGNEETDALFSRGGMESMYNVVSLALISLAFGGIMDSTGMLHSIVIKLSSLVRTIGNLTLTVLGTSLFINIFGANQYLAVILPGQMFEESYRDKRLKLKNLTRTLEGGGTLTAPLIPWNSSGVFVYATLGISALEYAPYAVLCWLTAIVVAIYGYAGVTMHKLENDEPEENEDV
ncbi:Na+/H+ antiporter NhaC [Alkalitalea saponilacus]|uniref:Na+:H+ antiporter, NhaC family n=1 Tax=Alkalitalea saponilacus TaxID=889453 RepID=A0A1T5AF09_9BACT|nr:Na+/H+ antiporter NhaC [Alkalitalea saponilacus]ASB48724.1 Na+/H+ antiporter NhaC [Alkalitalea saponilacus]SKB33592.1 Na+:H+ antiporter, NhaC family [Alkalitalea saponilacus]